MKNLKLKFVKLFFSLILLTTGHSTIITAVNGPGAENWNIAGTWDLGRVPKCGDTIVIPEGVTVLIPANVDLDDPANSACGETHIIVSGIISLSNGTRLELASGVCIDFKDTGILTTHGGGKGVANVQIGGSTEWHASDGDWVGPDNIGCSNALPVELISFNLEIINEKVELSFVTSTERELDYYIIESSRDGSFWQEISSVKAIGNSSNLNKYSSKDENPFNGESYYRLKNVDINGTVNILEIISCSFYSNKFLMYPIPVNKVMFIEGDNIEKTEFTLINSMGDVVEIEKTVVGDKLSFDFEPINTGVYFIKMENANFKKMERIVVIRNK
ncbi:MAG: T9SS type A sorting domain-containing protein [Flavobacteriia bacterium]|nr:T9SS type A sorting domain-containing protein [Flavobacteriia bacterium]